MPAKGSADDGDSKTRTGLAWLVIITGVVGIVVISIAVIWAADDHSEGARYVFAAVVPLFSTWVGAVIAFYFTREGLAAATASTLALSGARTPDTSVTEVMVPRAKIVSHDLKQNDNADDVLLKDLLDTMKAGGHHRIPILDPAGALVYVVHDSTINSAAPNPTTQKIVDLPDDAKKAITAVGTVGPNALLRDARAAMTAVEGCNDVFVTEGGKRTDAVVGWITNTDLAGIQ